MDHRKIKLINTIIKYVRWC